MDQSKVVELYTASLVDAEAVQGFLAENDITTSIRDEFNEGLHAGIPSGVPNQVTLQVMLKDKEKAEALLSQFLKG